MYSQNVIAYPYYQNSTGLNSTQLPPSMSMDPDPSQADQPSSIYLRKNMNTNMNQFCKMQLHQLEQRGMSPKKKGSEAGTKGRLMTNESRLGQIKTRLSSCTAGPHVTSYSVKRQICLAGNLSRFDYYQPVKTAVRNSAAYKSSKVSPAY